MKVREEISFRFDNSIGGQFFKIFLRPRNYSGNSEEGKQYPILAEFFWRRSQPRVYGFRKDLAEHKIVLIDRIPEVRKRALKKDGKNHR